MAKQQSGRRWREFFGYRIHSVQPQDINDKTDTAGILESYWIMPFRENCNIEFVNYGSEDIYLGVITGVSSIHGTGAACISPLPGTNTTGLEAEVKRGLLMI